MSAARLCLLCWWKNAALIACSLPLLLVEGTLLTPHCTFLLSFLLPLLYSPVFFYAALFTLFKILPLFSPLQYPVLSPFSLPQPILFSESLPLFSAPSIPPPISPPPHLCNPHTPLLRVSPLLATLFLLPVLAKWQKEAFGG